MAPTKRGTSRPRARGKAGKGQAKPAGFGRAAGRAARSADGRFAWHDLATTDVPGALRFYGELLGWTTRTTDMGPMGAYHVLLAGDVEIGGVMPLPGAGAPPCWLGYVGVRDVGAACVAVEKAGGALHRPPQSIPGAGGFAVVSDPTGGVIAPIQLGGPPTRDLAAPSTPGLPAWNELVTPNPEVAGPFYARALGWTVHPLEVGGNPYWIFRHEGEDVAGMIEAPPTPEPEAASWMIYFHVTDADASAARATDLGGAVLIEPFDVPTVGRCAVIADPAGVVFRLYRPEED